MRRELSAPQSCKIFTPFPLAKAIVAGLLNYPGQRWLEPCVGKGVFLDAMKELGVDGKYVIATDLDDKPAESDKFARTLRGTEFLTWASRTRYRFDKIVANPPFIALSRTAPQIQRAALQHIQHYGKASVNSNTWLGFLCACLNLLRPNGNLTFILPAAWDYADYAAPLRRSISQQFSRFEVHRSHTPLFSDAHDGCVVIRGIGFGESPRSTVRYEYEDIDRLVAGIQLPELCTKPVVSSTTFTPADDVSLLKDVVSITIGAVTGDANYFLLRESDRVRRGLPRGSLRPVLSKASHLISANMTKEQWNHLLREDQRIWLFSPPVRCLTHQAVNRYLRLQSARGGCQRRRFKIKIRDPWYKTPVQPRIDGFLSGTSTHGPWISFCGMPRLNASNTLYTVTFRNRETTQDEKAAWALSLLTTASRSALAGVMRRYADGLTKYEPGDIAKLSVRTPKRFKGAMRKYQECIENWLAGRTQTAQDLADDWFQKK